MVDDFCLLACLPTLLSLLARSLLVLRGHRVRLLVVLRIKLGWHSMAAIIYNLFVINKSGGLIFYKVVCLETSYFIYHTLPFLLLLRW